MAIQGVAGSFHEEVARQWFGPTPAVVQCADFPTLFEALQSGRAEQAVMAVENSLAGTLLPNLALLQEASVQVVGETYLRIGLHLMARPGTSLEELKTVHSHPIALRQCERYLRAKGLTLVDSEDTADSARLVAESDLTHLGAVASRRAAELYGLNILAEHVETNPRNFTRFLILSRKASTVHEPNKASLSFQLTHEPGSLAKCLQTIGDCGLNLTKIQSMPIIGRPNEYHFHLDLTWPTREAWQNGLIRLRAETLDLRIFGEYQAGQLPSLPNP